MHHWSRQAAIQALEHFGLSASNLRLARYWLSMWNDNGAPVRAAIKPSQIKDNLPGIAIFQCRPHESIHCRLAGSAIAMGLGMDVTGKDLVALTPPEFRAARLARTSRVALGAVSRRKQQFRTRHGEYVMVEDIQLPLSDLAEDGSRQVLYHADWRPKSMDRTSAEIVDGLAIAEGVEFFELAPI